MMKVAIVSALPVLGSAAFHAGEIPKAYKTSVVEPGSKLEKLLAKHKAHRALATDDINDIPESSTSLWIGTAMYNSNAGCTDMTSSTLFASFGDDIDFQNGCYNYGDGTSVDAGCTDTGALINFYDAANCGGTATKTWTYTWDPQCTMEDFGFISGYAYFSCWVGGTPWKAGKGYSNVDFAGDECLACGYPIGFMSVYQDVCFSLGGDATTLDACTQSEGTLDTTTYSVDDCTGTETAGTQYFNPQNCSVTSYNMFDDLQATVENCIANAPSVCGSASHSGAAIGLTGIMIAASFFLGKM